MLVIYTDSWILTYYLLKKDLWVGLYFKQAPPRPTTLTLVRIKVGEPPTAQTQTQIAISLIDVALYSLISNL